MSTLPSVRVRTLAHIVRLMLREFSDAERHDFFALLTHSGTLDGETIAATLAKVRGNISDAARVLGLGRRTLQKRMRDFGLPTGRAGRPRR